jgi:DNA-binding Lrp family transcriptional regulator
MRKDISLDTLDRIDRRILQTLGVQGRIAWSELAEVVGLSLTPTIRRVKRLEEQGIIDGYGAIFNEEKLIGGMNIFVSVTMEKQIDPILEIFEHEISKSNNVLSCYLMTGGYDYLLRVVVRDLNEYQNFLRETLTRIPGVAHVQSSFALRPVLDRSGAPQA